EKLKLLRVEVKLGGNEAQNAAIQHQKQADALGNTATEAEKATKALQDYQAKQKDSVIDSIYKSGWLDKGYTVAQANAILELQKAKGMSAILSKDEIDSALRNLKIIEEQQEREDKLTEAKRKQTKEAAKQAVLLAGNNEQARNMLRVYQSFRNAGLGDKQARVMTAQVGRETDFRNEAMFGSHKDANNGYTNTGFLSWQKSRSTKLMQSLQGQGVLDKNGKIQQTQDALDAMAKHAVQEAMTDKSYSKSKAALLNDDLDYRSLERIVAKNFVGWDYDGKKLGKAKASQHLAKQDSYYNQLNKILGDNPEVASKAISDLSKFEDEAYKARAKTLEEIKQLQATYDSETVARSKKREEEINKATILGQLKLIPKINERFDAEEKLAQKQFDFEVNGYKWTEEQKLDYTYETNSLRLVAEGKLSEDQRKVALDGLEQQKQQELELIQSTREKQLLEAKSSYMGETELAIRRYQIELDEIKKVADEKRKAGLLSANNMGQFQTLDSASDKVFQSGFNASQQVFQQNDPRGYAQWDLQNRYSTDAGGILNTYIDQTNGINLIADEEQRSSQLLAAREQYLQSRKALDEKYAQDERDLNSSLFETQLGQLDSLTSQLSGYWSNMTGIVKNAAGEQSGIYKGMYIAQQAFAIGSATISALQAYNQILASPWYLDVISKSTAANLVLGMGMANVGLIAGQTIAGFSDGGYTGSGGKYQPAGIVHKGEVVWSQEDIKRWGGVGLVEKMRKSANPEAFLNNNASADSVMRRAMMSSSAFIESQKQSDIFNQPVQDTQIIYKGNRDTPKLASSANSDLFHDGKVYFSSSGLVQDRSNLDDVQDFTLGRTSRPQAEIMPSIEQSSPTINFKIEVVNQVSGATVEAEQLDEQTVRIIVTDELDKQLPRKVPKLVSDQIGNPNSTISRSLTENTTARRNR
ncbi:phage tail protein, partial [Acinetobacter baumannii]|nr:phage tail protein [Acinetobacter baumannii]